ncbi:hypothetical protein HDV00_000111 [Rhizophlyctis rosea]|nr:hypothetical protein HDV00_000111 [Rhizophlyctis rosea]
MDEENKRRLAYFHNNLFAAERAIAVGNGQPDPAPPSDPPLPEPKPLKAWDNVRNSLKLLDHERQRALAEGAAEGVPVDKVAEKVVRWCGLGRVKERYERLYDEAFQLQLDPNTPGSVANEIEKAMKKKAERKNAPDRLAELPSTGLRTDALDGVMMPECGFTFNVPDLTELGVSLEDFDFSENTTAIETNKMEPRATNTSDMMLTRDPSTPLMRAPDQFAMQSSSHLHPRTRHGDVPPDFHADSRRQRDPPPPASPPRPQYHHRHNSTLQNHYNQHLQNMPKSNPPSKPAGTTVTLDSMSARYNTSTVKPMDVDVAPNVPQKRPYRDLESDDEREQDAGPSIRGGGFVSATDKMHEDNLKKHGQLPPKSNQSNGRGKTLGVCGKRSKFVSPLSIGGESSDTKKPSNKKSVTEGDERLRNLEPRIVEMITNEIMDKVPEVGWEDIAGLEHAKSTIQEIVVWPMLRPDIFTGLRAPPKGLLLFGPPGTGKTLIGKCIASQAKATFFSISSSSLTSKWVGEGEKMVRALFALARVHQPSVIFVDEIDSLLTQRNSEEHDHTRKLKTEFLVQFDGCGTDNNDRILMIGATNRPQEIDEAARRRFRKRLYIPLPDDRARKSMLQNLLRKELHNLTDDQLNEVVRRTDGYSGSDMRGLCEEAALGPVRDGFRFDGANVNQLSQSDVRPISLADFLEALSQVRASVSNKDLDFYLEFDRDFGSIKRR